MMHDPDTSAYQVRCLHMPPLGRPSVGVLRVAGHEHTASDGAIELLGGEMLQCVLPALRANCGAWHITLFSCQQPVGDISQGEHRMIRCCYAGCAR
jgi:hypothetical protein